MTDKQELFCNYYIESLDAKGSAIKAGYSKKTASSIANAMLNNYDIKKYISTAMVKKNNKLIASQDEILSTLTAIMRRESFIEVSYVEKTTSTLKTYKKYPTFAEATRAAELLGKRYNMWNDRQIIEIEDADIHVTIEGDGD